MKTTRTGRACLIVIGLFLASGCAEEDASTAQDPGKPRIAVIMKSLANEFFVTMEAGTREHHASHTG